MTARQRFVQRRALTMQFIVIFGPPAVGKMAVGLEIEAATGIRLFHNHMTIEPVLRFFPFGIGTVHASRR